MKNFIYLLAIIILAVSCSKKNDAEQNEKQKSNSAAIVKFIEVGSDKCVPCKQMKEVTANITAKYKEQLDFEMIDINKEKDAASKYGVQLIPTQIFYNKDGKEFFRHVGYFPEEKIDSLLQANGLKIVG